MIDWLLKLIERSTMQEIHPFSLDFGIALLANIQHARVTLTVLEKDSELTKNVL